MFFDEMLLNCTEWLCRRVQVLTGRTNVWMAVQLTNLSIVVYFVWAGVYFVRSDVTTRLAIAAFCAGLLYLLTQTIFKVSIESSEQNAYRRVAKGLRNPRRVRDAMLRVLFLTLAVLLAAPMAWLYVQFDLSAPLLSYSLVALTTVLLYVLACDPLPPCGGKLREWLGALRPAPLVRPERVPVRPNPGAPRWPAGRTRIDLIS
jgi:hypothetical protein